ncbi:MAG: sugar phosphate isomerase/epimerase family protein [Akkermansiaceae bacterium]
MNRRNFIQTSIGTLGTLAAGTFPAFAFKDNAAPLFEISLAEWSLHNAIWKKELTNMDFPKYAKDEFGITAVEYVNGFFKDKAKDKTYLTELKKRTGDEGIKNVLIMIDGEGSIGAADAKKRQETVDKHKKWVEAAKFLGCHSVRVNAHGGGKNRDDKAKNVIAGLTKLSEFAKDFDINVIVENHGGLSSDGAWVKQVLSTVNMPNCGSLPDFGNFHEYDRYQGITDLMPFAKGVSAKSRVFDDKGNEVQTDFYKAMKICLDAGYRGHVGIEYEGKEISEQEGIRKTKALLEKVREAYVTG